MFTSLETVGARKFVVDAWLSPNRKEVYDHNYISDDKDAYNNANEMVFNFLDEYYDGNIFDLFNVDDNGLWRIIVEAEETTTRSWTDCGYEYDTDFNIHSIWVQRKCDSFSELKHIWKYLKENM